jgi:hypothetical protein
LGLSPDSLGARIAASKEVLDTLVLLVGNTSSSILDLQSLVARIDFASTVFAADVLNTGDLSTVGTVSF